MSFSFRRAWEIAYISLGTLHPKLDFILYQYRPSHDHRERRLFQGFSIPRSYIGVDWNVNAVIKIQRDNKHNAQLTAVGSADNTTSYVFYMHMNFDLNVEAVVIDYEATALAEPKVQMLFRRQAGLWLASE